jgi:uncharacterized protein YukE
MTGTVGAELSTLKTLHQTFQQKSQEALDISNAVDKGLASTVWTGKYSQDFHNAWQDYKKNLQNLHDALNGAANDVKTNHNNIAAATGESDRI